MRRSRTYKLRLSPQGIDLFLDFHGRLARLLCDFIPYGLTLSVAIAILESRGADDVFETLQERRFHVCLGEETRFVGTTIQLTQIMTRIAARLAESREFSRATKLGHAAILLAMSAEDQELLDAHRRFAENRFAHAIAQ
jgi:hypothetical protein